MQALVVISLWMVLSNAMLPSLITMVEVAQLVLWDVGDLLLTYHVHENIMMADDARHPQSYPSCTTHPRILDKATVTTSGASESVSRSRSHRFCI